MKQMCQRCFGLGYLGLQTKLLPCGRSPFVAGYIVGVHILYGLCPSCMQACTFGGIGVTCVYREISPFQAIASV
jgi:hypothetical protein